LSTPFLWRLRRSPSRRSGAPRRLRPVRGMGAMILLGLLFLGLLTSTRLPAPAGAKEPSQSQSPCTYLSKSIATEVLGGLVVRTSDNGASTCSYERHGTNAHSTVVSLIITRPNRNSIPRIQRLMARLYNTHVNGTRAYWYRTPSHLVGGDQAGSLSVFKGGLLLLIAVRGVPDPESTAAKTMSQAFRGL
jgi:hypothetical protein